MAIFSTSKIIAENEAIADILKKERKIKKLNLRDTAVKLGINYRYLEAIEKGDFNALPKGLYGKNYLREYAQFLNLDANKILEFYEKENPDTSPDKQKNLFSQKIPSALYFLTVPKLIKNFIIVLVILVCVGYLGYYLNNIITPPEVTILNPVSDLIISENHISIAGKAEPETEITINGEVVLINSEGLFEKDINLKTGVNIISIVGQKKYSRKNKITRQILVKE
ncbi:hypothetical protein DRH27_01900 [Candidatus Falkowbacteria bacterium]|nr:MAG: hypothetical protein DRH27_01900 [Candidatus Falkowbacteria bacterium]